MSRPTTLLGQLDGLTAEQVNYRFARLVAQNEWGMLPELDEYSFALVVAELANRPRLFTFVDLFCGAGGSSTGLVMAGGLLRFAANHSKNNIAIHSKNHPDAEHACADLDHYDMRNIPTGADVLWASPICTELSPAGGNGKGKVPKQRRGQRVAVTPGQGVLEIEGHVPEEDYIRTRATFWDVVRAVEVHQFKYVIVENVVEAAWKWRLFAIWLQAVSFASSIGYGFQIVCVSAAHVGDALNPHAPQRRDRMYVVFHRLDQVKPDLEVRPLAHCDECGIVQGVQFWKKSDGTLCESGQYFQVGKYGPRTGQYYYICPNIANHTKHDRSGRPPAVTPLERPAAAVIDWSDLGVPIADRAQHGLPDLVPNTLARIRKGIQMFARPTQIAHAGNTYERPGGDYVRAWPIDQAPFMAQQTTVTTGMATPAPASMAGAFLVTNKSDGGRPQDRVSSPDEAMAAVTTGRHQSLAVPPGAFVDTMRNNTLPTSAAWEALTGITAGGNCQSLAVPPLVVPYNRTGIARPAHDSPMPTMHTVDGAGLAGGLDSPPGEIDVMSVLYRTLKWNEQARAQRFPVNYQWVGTAGQRTAGAGNAVASNVACWLGQRVAAALNKTAALV